MVLEEVFLVELESWIIHHFLGHILQMIVCAWSSIPTGLVELVVAELGHFGVFVDTVEFCV